MKNKAFKVIALSALFIGSGTVLAYNYFPSKHAINAISITDQFLSDKGIDAFRFQDSVDGISTTTCYVISRNSISISCVK